MERNAVEDSLEPTRGMPIEPPIHPKSMHRALIVAIGGTGRRWKRNARPYGTAALLLLLLVLLSLSSAVYPAIQLVSASEPVVVDSKTAPSPTIIDTNGSTPTKVSTAGTASASTDEPTSASKKDDWTTLFLDTAKRTLLEGTQSFLQLLPSSFTSIYPFARTLLGEVKDWPTTLLAYRLVLRPPFLVNLYSKYSSHLNEPYAQAPSSSKGSILILEAKGGSDKMPSWHRHAGHRPDTVAIANAITRRGWKAVVWPYEDSTRGKFEELVKNGIVGDDDGNTMESASADETATANNGTNSSAESATANTNTNTNTTNNNSNGKPAFEALVWRVNPQSHDPYVRSLVPLEQLVVDLSSSSTIPLLAPHPKLMHTLGAKQGLFHLRGMKIGMADTKRYTSRSELAKFATVLSGSYNEGIDALQKARLDLQYRGTSNSTMVYSPGFGGRVLKQNRGSQGEGVFVVRLLNPPAWSAEGYQVWPLPSNNEDLTRLPKALPLDTQLSIQEASDNKFRNSTLGDFLTWMEAMFMEAPETVEGEGKEDRMVIDQMFLRRIREGEVRVVMVHEVPHLVIHKVPSPEDTDSISATLSSGAVHVPYLASSADLPPRFRRIIRILHEELPEIRKVLLGEGAEWPLLWTMDFILRDKPILDPATLSGNKEASMEEEEDDWTLGEINASCPGLTTAPLALFEAIAEALEKDILRCRASLKRKEEQFSWKRFWGWWTLLAGSSSSSSLAAAAASASASAATAADVAVTSTVL